MVDGWPFEGRLGIGVRPVRLGVALMTVTGEIDIATVPSLRGALARLTADRDVRLLVCDLSEVAFLGCAGISVLLDARTALVARGARLRLVATSSVVLRPLAIMRLLDVLPVESSVDRAVQ